MAERQPMSSNNEFILSDEEYQQRLAKKFDIQAYISYIEEDPALFRSLFSKILKVQETSIRQQKEEVEKPWQHNYQETRSYYEIIGIINEHLDKSNERKIKVINEFPDVFRLIQLQF